VTRLRRGLGFRVTVLAALVGATVGGAALLSAAGDCAGPPADLVCQHLARILSERLGIAAALVTVIVVLTFAGLARLEAERWPGRKLEE
jgi:hypothetical protein